MKIYLDGLFYKSSGIGRYYSNLIKVLSKDFEIVTHVPKKYQKEWTEEFSQYGVSGIFVNYEKFNVKGLLRNQELKNLKADIYFFPQVNTPLFFKHPNIVTTIHDVIPLESKEYPFYKKSLLRFLYINAIKKSKRILTVSNTSKKHIKKFFKINNIKVIYNFIEDDFCKKNERIVEDDYILFVGNRKKNKNLKKLLEAIKEIDIKLVIAGKREKSDIDFLIEEIKDKVIEITPDENGLKSLYFYAKLLVFPSFQEGFGYPPLEAISCNTPAVTSNIEVLKEILGEKITCIDPNSTDSIKKCILKGLKNHNEFLTEGKKRLEKFKESAVSKQYIQFFRTLK